MVVTVEYELTLGDRVLEVSFDPDTAKARVGTRDYEVETTNHGNRVIVAVDGKNFAIEVIQGRVYVNGDEVRFTIQKARPALLGRRREAAAQRGARIQSPMPGRIVSVLVKPGEKVVKGQGVMVLEAMKMQNEVTAPADGLVKAIHCKPGDNVDPGKVLVEIE